MDIFSVVNESLGFAINDVKVVIIALLVFLVILFAYDKIISLLLDFQSDCRAFEDPEKLTECDIDHDHLLISESDNKTVSQRHIHWR